jgi:hypothetical protein
MFGTDRFHPSAEGYQAAVDVVLPSALAALGLAPERTAPVPSLPSLPAMAVDAADHPGTEVRPADGSPPALPPTNSWTRWHRWVDPPRQVPGWAGRRVAPLLRSLSAALLERLPAARTRPLAVPSVSAGPHSSTVVPSGAD